MPLPPRLTPDERRAALAKAAAARRQRAEMKEKLKMGSTTLKELFDQTGGDDVVAQTRVVVVLESLPGVGKVRARRVMKDVGISGSRKLKGLGVRQRHALLKQFSSSS